MKLVKDERKHQTGYMTEAKHDFIAPRTDPNTPDWARHTNDTTLVDRDFPSKPGPTPKFNYPITPASPPHGTLISDDGDGLSKRPHHGRRKSAHRKKV